MLPKASTSPPGLKFLRNQILPLSTPKLKTFLEIISLLRAEKSKLGLNIGAEINTLSLFHPTFTVVTLAPFEFDLLAVSRAKKLTLTKSDEIKVEIVNE